MSAQLVRLSSQVPKPDTPAHLQKYCAKLVKLRQTRSEYTNPTDDYGAISAVTAMTALFSLTGDITIAAQHFHNWWALLVLIPASVISPIVTVYFLRDSIRYNDAESHLVDLPSAVTTDFLPSLNNILASLSALEPSNQAAVEELNAVLHQATTLHQQKEQTRQALIPLTPTTLLNRSRRAEYLTNKQAYDAACKSYQDLLDSVTQTATASALALLEYRAVKDTSSTVDLTALQERLSTHTDVYQQLHAAPPPLSTSQ